MAAVGTHWNQAWKRRGEEKNLEKWRLEYLWLQEKGTRLEQKREEKIARIFFQKIAEGKCKGEDLQNDNIPKLGEKWNRMYEWILVLMGYKDEMVYGELKALRTDRIKYVLYVAAGIGESSKPEERIRRRLRKENPRIPGDSQRRKAKKE